MVTVATMPQHPAKYTDVLLACLRPYPSGTRGRRAFLIRWQGVGKIGLLRDYGFAGRIVANEIEPEWAEQAPAHVEIHVGDAANMTVGATASLMQS